MSLPTGPPDMSSQNAILSLIGWTFLPGLISSTLQRIYYGLTIRAGEPHPAPGTPRHARHRRRLLIAVVAAYLLYTVVAAEASIRGAGNYYNLLGVPHGATERDVRARMRRLAALHHPDKAAAQSLQQQQQSHTASAAFPSSGHSGGSAQGQDPSAAATAAHNYFILLQRAAETLSATTTRFAYERFGPDVLGWVNTPSSAAAAAAAAAAGRSPPGGTTVRDLMWRGLQQQLVHYGATATIMYVMGVLKLMRVASWWRWLFLAAVCITELVLATRPGLPWILRAVVNPALAMLYPSAAAGAGKVVAADSAVAVIPAYLPFQLIALLRQISLTTFIALNQLAPLLMVDEHGADDYVSEDKERTQRNLDTLDSVVESLHNDATRLVDMEIAPFAGDENALKGLKGHVKDFLVKNTVRSDPVVRDAMGNELKKRRTGVPFGAKGNR